MPNIDYANRKPRATIYDTNLNIRITKEMQERLYDAKKMVEEDVASIVRQAIDLYLNALNGYKD